MRSGSREFLSQKTTNWGFTYIGVLAILAVMMIAIGAVVQIWHTQMQRENEQELLFVGNEFRDAIARYSQESGKGFPTSLQALLGGDGDTKFNKRYLRKMYRDPFTGATTWGLVLGVDNQIVGVHSLSEMKPYKTAQFADKDSSLEGKTKYSEWQFVYAPQKAQPTAPLGGTVDGIPRPVPRVGDAINQTSHNGSLTTVSRGAR